MILYNGKMVTNVNVNVYIYMHMHIYMDSELIYFLHYDGYFMATPTVNDEVVITSFFIYSLFLELHLALTTSICRLLLKEEHYILQSPQWEGDIAIQHITGNSFTTLFGEGPIYVNNTWWSWWQMTKKYDKEMADCAPDLGRPYCMSFCDH